MTDVFGPSVYYQDQVAKRVKKSVMYLEEEPGRLLSRRPFQVSWFSSQVAICLALWSYDHTLMQALELAKTFLIPLDALCILWPCEGAFLNLCNVFTEVF